MLTALKSILPINHVLSTYYYGDAVTCKICNWKGRKFHRNTICPICQSKTRTRLIPYSLEHFKIIQKDLKILHIAPNEPQYKYITNNLKFSVYDRMDIEQKRRTNLVMDLTQTTLQSGFYDLILIWHVLEHIPEDRKAIKEMNRILKTGGSALVSVPIHPKKNPRTFEDPTIPRDRYREVHGHEDHCRSCGFDYYKRFEDEGFSTQTLHVKDLAEEECKKFGLSIGHTAWNFTKI